MSFAVYKYEHAQFGPVMLLLEGSQQNGSSKAQIKIHSKRGSCDRPIRSPEEKKLTELNNRKSLQKSKQRRHLQLPSLPKPRYSNK